MDNQSLIFNLYRFIMKPMKTGYKSFHTLFVFAIFFSFLPGTVFSLESETGISIKGSDVKYATIQDAINAANTGDIVLVADGRYTGSGNIYLDFLGKAITVSSASEIPENCIIDGVGEGPGFIMIHGEKLTSIVSGFTITNCRSMVYGGGVYCSSSSSILKTCSIIDNKAGTGGNIYFDDSSSKVENCIISGLKNQP